MPTEKSTFARPVSTCLGALFTTIALLAGVRAGNAAVHIVYDPGGWIGTYVARYDRVRVSGDSVIIDGYCASACTIVLGEIPHDRICVTSRAQLGFHAAFNPGPKGPNVINAAATQDLYSMYPPEVRNWIDQRGGLTRRIIFLSGRELAALYRSCPIDPASPHRKRSALAER